MVWNEEKVELYSFSFFMVVIIIGLIGSWWVIENDFQITDLVERDPCSHGLLSGECLAKLNGPITHVIFESKCTNNPYDSSFYFLTYKTNRVMVMGDFKFENDYNVFKQDCLAKNGTNEDYYKSEKFVLDVNYTIINVVKKPT